MKVLITGGAGYVGSLATTEFAFAGHDVVVLDKAVYGGESLLALRAAGRGRFETGDIRSRADLDRALDGVEAVVHLAAVVGEPACALNEDAARAINVDGTAALLAAATDHGVRRFIYVSTCSNYGVSAPNVLADEDSALHPLSHYAKAKVEAERMTLATGNRMVSTVLRLGTICGLAPRMRFDLLISDLARAAVLGRTIDIFAPDAWRPFLHIRDAARAFAAVLKAPPDSVGGRVFNVIGENYQKRGLVDMVRRHFPQARIEVTSKQPDLRDYRVSGERIREAIGFTPASSVEDAFVETAAAVADGVFRDPFWPGHSAIPFDAGLFALRSGTTG